MLKGKNLIKTAIISFIWSIPLWAASQSKPVSKIAHVTGTVLGTGISNNGGYIGAGLAMGLAAIGAGIAVGYVGAAVVGSVSEKPENMGKMLIFLGLAEGIAIYGLLIAIMILVKTH